MLTYFFIWPVVVKLLFVFPYRNSQNKINLTLLILVVKQWIKSILNYYRSVTKFFKYKPISLLSICNCNIHWVDVEMYIILYLFIFLFHIILLWRSVCSYLLWRRIPRKKIFIHIPNNWNPSLSYGGNSPKYQLVQSEEDLAKKFFKLQNLGRIQCSGTVHTGLPDPTSLTIPSYQHMHLMFRDAISWMPLKASSGCAVAYKETAELVLRVELGILKSQQVTWMVFQIE